MIVPYKALVLLFSAVLCAGFWSDNTIHSLIPRFWWLTVVAAYGLLCLGSPILRLHSRWQILISATCGFLMLLSLLIFDDVITLYLCGAILLFGSLSALYLLNTPDVRSIRPHLGVVALIAAGLLILPIAVNRVVIKLPNLSAGTYLTLQASRDRKPGLSAQFFNRIDDHHELTVNLGTQLYFQQSHDAPLLRVDILRDKIVVRILSIRYDTRLAYVYLPLFEISGDSLSALEAADTNASFGLKMEPGRLLID
ncbi:MAG: hypothetical protein WBM41_19890, partial [Arenicellales bacterium]